MTMNNFLPDQAQVKSLASWYKEGNPLRLESRHPLIKLAGEAGEILDAYGKEEYKPNWSWWTCSTCGCSKRQHEDSPYACKNYFPKIISELGDYSYYLRIITFQQGVSFEMLCDGYTPFTACLEELLNDLAYRSTKLHKMWLKTKKVNPYELQILTFIFLTILERLEVSLEEVLNLNYKKLNSENTQHGWSSAR